MLGSIISYLRSLSEGNFHHFGSAVQQLAPSALLPSDQPKIRNLVSLFFIITDRPCAAAGGECRLTREEEFCDEQDGLFLSYLCAGNRNRKCCIPQAKGTVVFKSLLKYDIYNNITINICFFI